MAHSTEIWIKDLNDLPNAVASFLPFLDSHKIFAFDAEMGTGKTTFISALIKEMGTKDEISSPTFAIVNEYLTQDFGTSYHLDLYRIEEEEEAYDIGIEEILDGTNYAFIEWPSKIENLLPPETVRVSITNIDNQRKLLIHGN